MSAVPAPARPLLEVTNLEAYYGRTKALHGVTFAMAEGGITVILGANGAGKTTTLRAISGLIRPRRGVVEVDGVRVLVDQASAPIVAGSTLEFNDALLGGGLKMLNPQAKHECACGESFSI